MKKEGLIFNSQAKADISDMGRIEELRCFSRFVEVKAANIYSLFFIISSKSFFTERILYIKSNTHFLCIYSIFLQQNNDNYF